MIEVALILLAVAAVILAAWVAAIHGRVSRLEASADATPRTNGYRYDTPEPQATLPRRPRTMWEER